MCKKINILKKNIILSKISSSLTFQLSDKERELIEHEKFFYENQRAVIISALKIIQKNHGWVQDEAILEIANILNISDSDVEEVATFYSYIFRHPVGRYIIRYCDSSVCYINGYKNIQYAIEKTLNITPGETTIDRLFTLLPTCCLGNCDKGPVMMINDDTFIHLTPEKVNKILEEY